MRSGPRGGTGPWGQYKTPGMLGFIRAQHERARSALCSLVVLNFLPISYSFREMLKIIFVSEGHES